MVIFVMLLLVATYSCVDDWQDSYLIKGGSLKNNDREAIAMAKAWFEANKPKETALRSTDGRAHISAKPEWNRAFLRKSERYEVVESEIMTQGRFSYLSNECMKKEKKYGGMVLYHHLDGRFSNGCVYTGGEVTAMVSSLDAADPGDTISGCVGTHASIRISSPPNTQHSSSPIVGGKYAVAHFHTHTPLTYCPGNVGRPAGPSQPDKDVINSSAYQVPGLVYDYVAINYPIYDHTGIMGGHTLHASATVTPYGFYTRRQTPPFN